MSSNRSKLSPMSVFFLLVVAVGAIAAPVALQMSSSEKSTPKSEKSGLDAKVKDDKGETKEKDDETAEQEKAKEAEDGNTETHGAAVSTAAHCEVKGKAHGELVRSIAKDKEATVATAEAACAAAEAAAAAAGDVAKTRPVKPAKPAKTVGVNDDDDASDEPKPEKEPKTTGKPDTAGGPPEGHGKK